MEKSIVRLVFLALLTLPSLSWGVTAEEMFRSLRGLSSEQRKVKIAEEAKREGKVIWYTTTSNSQNQKVVDRFNEKYPGVEIQWVRGKSHTLFNRIMAEAGAGKHLVDVSNAGSSVTLMLSKNGLFIPVETPLRDAYDPQFKDREGYWVSLYVLLAPFAYNTELVKKEDAPRSFASLLDPRWKGKMGLDSRPNRFIPALLQEWGKKRTSDYLKKLAAQEPALVRGHTAAAQLLAAGQFHILIEPFAYSTLRLKHQGAPVDVAWQKEFVPGSFSAAIALLKKAPHPHAALLFYEYLLSEDGQRVLADFGRTTTRRGLKPMFPELKDINQRARLALIKPENAEDNIRLVAKFMKELFLKK